MKIKISAGSLKVLVPILFAAAVTLFLKSCELEDSMMCRKATYVNGELESATEWEKYYGLRLEQILDEQDVTIGNRTTRWECR